MPDTNTIPGWWRGYDLGLGNHIPSCAVNSRLTAHESGDVGMGVQSQRRKINGGLRGGARKGKDTMNDSGPVTNQIAASIEDVKALLADNRNLSIAFLSRRIRDLEEEVRERFREQNRTQEQRINSLETAVEKLKERMNLAGVKFKEMREDVDKVKAIRERTNE